MGSAPRTKRKPTVIPTLLAIGVKGFHPSALMVVFYRPESPDEEVDLKENLYSRNVIESIKFSGWCKALEEETLEFIVPISLVSGIHVFDLAHEVAQLPLEDMGNRQAQEALQGYAENISRIHGILNSEGEVQALPWIMAYAIGMTRPAEEERT